MDSGCRGGREGRHRPRRVDRRARRRRHHRGPRPRRRARVRPHGRAGLARRADLPPARRAAEAARARRSPSARRSSTPSRRAPGATKNDSWVDIDGGIGVLFTYSSKGRRELPNAKVYVDGAVEALSKDGSFIGQHIYTRLPGVAVQINAFNFPVWGSLEKFAPAFLAGMPTAREAGHAIRIPRRGDGAHHGRVGAAARGLAAARLRAACPTLFDHLRLGDLVAFTGSASTAERLRSHDSVQTGGVRVLERDRLDQRLGARPGCAWPAPPSSTRTSSSSWPRSPSRPGRSARRSGGRSCRPRRWMPWSTPCAHRLAERVVVGDPRAEGVTMGPLASLEQRDEVLRQVGKLRRRGRRARDRRASASRRRARDGSRGPAPDGAFVDPDDAAVRRLRRRRRARGGGVRAGLEHLRLRHRRRRPSTWSRAAAGRSSRASRRTIPSSPSS